MGVIMGFLKLALICIHFLAWPVIALGYPLLESIRAVETGSEYQLRKLVIYWILFSLISLVEFAFVKIIEWIPFWSSIRLIATFWLVMPQFDGACHAYQKIVCPLLSVTLRAVIKRFYEPKEEKPRKRVTFLDIAERYIKENGSEALEKLIASKHECKECDDSQRDTQPLEPEEENDMMTTKQEPDANNSQRYPQLLEPEEKNVVTTSQQLKEPDAVQLGKEMLEATKKSAATEAKKSQHAQSNAGAGVPNGTDAAANVKEMTPPEASAENGRTEIPPLKKAKHEWKCGLCKVTVTSEKTLNDHLRGRIHKSNCESLRACKLNANDSGPSCSATGNSKQGNWGAVKNKVGEGSQQKSSGKTQERVQFQAPGDQQKQAKAKHNGGANQVFGQCCNICNVKLTSDIDLASHLKGRRHLSNIQEMLKREMRFPEHAIDHELAVGNEQVRGAWGSSYPCEMWFPEHAMDHELTVGNEQVRGAFGSSYPCWGSAWDSSYPCWES